LQLTVSLIAHLDGPLPCESSLERRASLFSSLRRNDSAASLVDRSSEMVILKAGGKDQIMAVVAVFAVI